MDKFDQTAPKMLVAIKGCFTKHNLSEIWEKVIYISVDGAPGNSGKDSGLIANPGRAWLGILCIVFQSSLEIGTKRFYKSGGRIIYALVLSL